MKMNLREAVLKLFSGGILLSILEFVAIAGFTRTAGTAAIGSFFIFQTVTGLIGIPSDLGVSRAAEKQLSAENLNGEVITTSIIVKILLITPWILGLFAASHYVEQYIAIEQVVPLVALGILTDQTKRLTIRFLSGQMNIEKTPLLRVIGKLVWVVTGLTLIYSGWGAIGIVAGFILGDIAVIIGVLIRMEIAVSRPSILRARRLINFGRYVFIGSVGAYAYSWMDVAILRFFVPPSLIGAYEIAWRIAALAMILTEAIRNSLFPQISQWYSENKTDKIESAFRTWLQPPFYVTIPAFTGAVVMGKDVLNVVFGAEVLIAFPVLLIFMLEKILRSIHMILSPSLFAMDQPELGYRGSAVAVVVNLVLNIILIPFFGLIGAAMATTVSSAVSAFINIMYVKQFASLQLPWGRIGWSVGSATIMSAVVFLIRPVLPVGWIRLIMGVSAGIVIYFIILFFNKGIRLETKKVLNELLV